LVYRQDDQWWKETNVKLGVREREGNTMEEAKRGFEEVRNPLERLLNI
jgi:hypothetical protein